jgi:hypothetical protein
LLGNAGLVGVTTTPMGDIPLSATPASRVNSAALAAVFSYCSRRRSTSDCSCRRRSILSRCAITTDFCC